MSGDERSGSPPEEGVSRFENVAALARQARLSGAILPAGTDKNGAAHRQLAFGDDTDAIDPWWHSNAMAAIRAMALTGRAFQAFSLVEEFGLGEPSDHHYWGAVFHEARRAGLVKIAGAEPSRRPTAGGSLVRVWRGVPR